MFKKRYSSVLMNDIRDFDKLNILDVREDDEYRGGHIKNAKSLPLSGLSDSIDSLDATKEYYVVCHAGGRSKRACDILSKKGFKVTNVMGGMSAYKGRTVR